MVKVIASSVRKGNVLDVDGKLYVVLTAQNFHPGKGTPVTQVDMRRIVDGVKVSERWRTTETVERAIVDDRNYTFLYQDGEGFHFMDPNTYDQIIAAEDIIGDAAPYLTDGCTVTLSTHDVELAFEIDDSALAQRAGGNFHGWSSVMRRSAGRALTIPRMEFLCGPL